MGEREELEPLLDILLDAIAAERGVARDFLSLEVEQVALQTLFAAFRAGRRRKRTLSDTAYEANPERQQQVTVVNVPVRAPKDDDQRD